MVAVFLVPSLSFPTVVIKGPVVVLELALMIDQLQWKEKHVNCLFHKAMAQFFLSIFQHSTLIKCEMSLLLLKI